MKGDFTRKTFKKKKHYRKVNMQQGRVQLDADWNEQMDILLHHSSSALEDIIGKSGVPVGSQRYGSEGFKIVPGRGNDYTIKEGHYYVDGILCENEADVEASKQPDLPSVDEHLFYWDEVPGKGVKILQQYFKERLGDGWKNAIFKKTSNGRKITGSLKMPLVGGLKKSLAIRLLPRRNKATLDIGKVAADEFAVKRQKGKLSILHKKSDALPNKKGKYLVYLEVWERHLTGLDDPEILEPALGGPDTATRTKIVWQVKIENLDGNKIGWKIHAKPKEICGKAVCPSHSIRESGKMQARSRKAEPSKNVCILAPEAGYQRLSNQLYRVEIHREGTVGTANPPTFKWSRDNGSVVAKVKRFSGDTIVIPSMSKDRELSFSAETWVEVIDDRRELWGKPGTFVKLIQVKEVGDANETELKFNLQNVNGDQLTEENFPEVFNPKVRRWDMPDGPIEVSIPAENDGYIGLEDGVEVRFDGTFYRTGDYWLIPARPALADIMWPRGTDGPKALPPEGIHRHFSSLALLDYEGGGTTVVSDCRKFFPATIDLPLIYYRGGNGQEGPPETELPYPLKVGVATGEEQSEELKLKVRFEILEGNGWLRGADQSFKEESLDILVDGPLVQCCWKLGKDAPDQQVKAVLLDADDSQMCSPIYFNANLDRPILYYVSGDGQEAPPESELPFPLMAGVATGKKQIEEAKIRFKIEKGDGWLLEGNEWKDAATLKTDSTGLVRCRWKLGKDAPDQQVKATLLDAVGNETELTLFFNASLVVVPQIIPANTGIITLNKSEKRIFGPFNHYLTKIGAPPAILLGFVGQVSIGPREAEFHRTPHLGGDVVTFNMKCSRPQTNSYIKIIRPDGRPRWKTNSFGADDWEKEWWGARPIYFVPESKQLVAEKHMELTRDDPEGIWSWIWYDERDEQIISGTFKVKIDGEWPSIHIWSMTPRCGDYGDKILVSGRNAAPGDLVNLYWDVVKDWDGEEGFLAVSPNKTPDSGEFTIQFNVPEAASGGHYLWVKDKKTGKTASHGPFWVIHGPEPVLFMEDYGLYSFGKGLPRFKVVNVDLKGFKIMVEEAIKERLILRWWAIPAQEQKAQTSGPVIPEITLEPKNPVVGGPLIVTVVDPLASGTITVGISKGKSKEEAKIKLVETDRPGVFRGEFVIADKSKIEVKPDEAPMDIPGEAELKIVASYTVPDRKPVAADVMMKRS